MHQRNIMQHLSEFKVWKRDEVFRNIAIYGKFLDEYIEATNMM